ncbi:MAG: hypothetical protein H7A24_16245 [Leptospiraceae bacterium]|nr:hypothetical protein [Leptospiraceae bacterium]MCP5513439.1 hypothetical protein [Leptospiraceae bacterium]
MFQDTPYKRRQIISVFLLVFFFLGNILIYSFQESLKSFSPSFFHFLKHGFEGGLVGGLCDWFAVWKTYNAIERDSFTVADEIGKWVSRDLLNHNTLRDQLNGIIENPDNQKEIVSLLETYFDTPENTKKILDNLWAKIESPVVDYIVNYNFSSRDFQIISDTSQDKTILRTIKICVGEALLEIAEEEKFKVSLQKLIQEQNLITKFLSGFINVPEILKSYGYKLRIGEKIETKEEKYVDEIVTMISLSADKYILAWSNLTYEQKKVAVEALFFKIKEAMGMILAKFIIEYKEDLKARRSLSEYQPVKEVFAFIEDKIDQNVSEFIGSKISERLKSQDPKDFRIRLEWQTRNVLENIRINGTLLGFGLGSLIGISQNLFHP